MNWMKAHSLKFWMMKLFTESILIERKSLVNESFIRSHTSVTINQVRRSLQCLFSIALPITSVIEVMEINFSLYLDNEIS